MQTQISLLLDRSRPDTLTSQLVGQLRDAILVGRIMPGVRLPSSRRLSDQLGIGRNTVVRAYETLEVECLVESRPASGMFATLPPPDLRPAPGAHGRCAPEAALSRMPPARVPARAAAASGSRLSFDFQPGRPDAALFPLKVWRRLLQSCLAQGGAAGLVRPVDPAGLATLRAAIATHIASARGIAAEPGQIIIVSGLAEGLALVARLFLTPGSTVVMESPGSLRAATAFEASGAALHPVAVDAQGLLAADLPEQAAELLYLTPAHQYPTGATLSPARRQQVVDWARRHGCYIVEDDLGAEFRYEGGAPPAIAAGAPDCTLHLGSFSQALGAGLRLGYVVVPPHLVDASLAAKASLNGGSPWLEQAAVAEMIRSGAYASHLLRMRAAYRERRDHLLEALQRNFGEVEIGGAAGGLHLFWQLPPGVPDAVTVEALARRARIGVHALDRSRVFHPARDALTRRGLMLGYAALTQKQIDQGIARLSDAVDDALDGHRIGLADLLAHRPGAPGPAAPGQAGRFRRGRAKPAPRFAQQPDLPQPSAARAASRAREREAQMPQVMGLYQYPVKGLSPQPVAQVRIEAGRPFPFDRVFALARPGVAINAEAPRWAKKGLFVMLMLDEGLARVRTHLDPASLVLTVFEGDRPVLSADLADATARAGVEALFHRLAPTLHAPPVLVRAQDGHFMDKPDNVISLINLATLRSLEQQWGYPIDRLRFRANIYIDGAPPWQEFDWIGGDIRIGEAVFRADRRNGRCGATNVDPATGRRDLDIPGSLRRAFGHKDLGIYLVARNSAALAVGDQLERPGGTVSRATAPTAPLPAGRRAFICGGCYFVHRDAPGAEFADLPPGWQCPDCGSFKTVFRPHVTEAAGA